MVSQGFVQIRDLPVRDGVIDFRAIQRMLQLPGVNENIFLQCAALQQIYGSRLECPKSMITFPVHLDLTLKKLIWMQHQKFVSIAKWSLILQCPISWEDILKGFKQMVKLCKINKLWEGYYKIIHRILAVPLVVAGAHKQPHLSQCAWCGERVSIDHILLNCLQTNRLYDWVSDRLNQDFTHTQHIFGPTHPPSFGQWSRMWNRQCMRLAIGQKSTLSLVTY